jgi:hypothetical protein
MKTILVSSLAAAGLALSISSAFALGNSPQGAVITGTQAPVAVSHEQAAPRHFLSGATDSNSDAGLSSNAVEGRDFLNVQKGRY